MESTLFVDGIQDLKPVVAKGSSDSAALDAVFELLLRSGRDLPMVKTMMIPEAIDVSADNPRANLYAYCNSVMEPWDGPAAIYICRRLGGGFLPEWVTAIAVCGDA